jgi:hypothetical protein
MNPSVFANPRLGVPASISSDLHHPRLRVYSFLLFSLVILNVNLRFFTNKLNILPRVFNVFDIAIVGCLALLFLLNPGAWIGAFKYKNVLKYLLLFNLVLLISATFNSEHVYFQPALSQIIMLNEPIILFLVLVNLPFPAETFRRFSRLLFFLVGFEFVLGLIQLPISITTGQSEAIIGTFSGNAEQYASFLLLGAFYVKAKEKSAAEKMQRGTVKVLALVCMILLIDNKASWLGMVASLWYVYTLTAGTGFWGRVKSLAGLAFLAVFVLIAVVQFSPTLYKFEDLVDAWNTGNFTQLGKIKAYSDVATAFKESSLIAFVGSGPGTFYSRAAKQFYLPFYHPASLAYVASSDFQQRSSNSMAGVIEPLRVEAYFTRFYVHRRIFPIGSDQIDNPFASYIGILGEAGFVGILLYLGIYLSVFKRLRAACETLLKSKSDLYPLAVSTAGFLVYTLTVSVYNNWLETGRITTLLWSCIAMVLGYCARYLPDSSRSTDEPPATFFNQSQPVH